MSNLKVFTLAANGKTVREVTLASIKSVPEGEIHPHDFNHLERGRDVLFKSNELKQISEILRNLEKDADIVKVGVGDPTSCRSGEVIEQVVVIAPKGQRGLRTRAL